MNIAIAKRTNRGGSVTFSLRYVDTDGREVKRKVCRTEPNPTKASLRQWEREAYVAAHNLRKEAEEGPRGSTPPVVRRILDHGLRDFLTWCDEPGPGGQPNKASSTADNIRRHVEHFINWLRTNPDKDHKTYGVWTLDLILLNHVSCWRDHLVRYGVSHATANTYLASLGSWLSWALDHGHVYRNEVGRSKRFNVKRERAVLPIRTPADLHTLLGKLKPDQANVIALLACTGMRQGMLKALRRDSWSHAEATLSLPAGRNTTKRAPSTLLLGKRATEAVEAILASHDGPLLVGSGGGEKPFTSQINVWLKPHGVTPHDLRRFFITGMESIGAPKTVIDDLVGHSPGKVRGAYTPEVNLEAQRPWVEKFDEWVTT